MPDLIIDEHEPVGMATAHTTTRRVTRNVAWDEPVDPATPRGWMRRGDTVVGFYLDYGPGHHRAPHSSMVRTNFGDVERVWCHEERPCRTCQPGNILAVRYPKGPGTPSTDRYVETIDQARQYVQTGTISEPGA